MRTSPTTSQPRFHRLKSLTVVGGFLDGLKASFAPGLNCVIGARGTGKTTVLEFVRYALDAMPEDAAARKRIESLVEGNLEGGRIELGIETKDGLNYIVTRTAGEPPIVLGEDRKPTKITLKTGGVFKANIFSQNEVEIIADRSLSQLGLIDNFKADEIAEVEAGLRHVGMELKSNASAIAPLEEQIAGLDDELSALPNVAEKLKGMATAAGGDAEAINKAHKLKALRDREKRALEEMSKYLAEYAKNVGEYIGLIGEEAGAHCDEEMLKGPNKEILEKVCHGLKVCGKDVDAALQKVLDRIEAEQGKIETAAGKLEAAHSAQEMAFRKLIEKHQEAQGQAAERNRLDRVRNDLLLKQRQKDDAAQKLAKLREKRTELMGRLSELRDERFKLRKAVADEINGKLSPTIKVSILQYGNPERYGELIEEALAGKGLKPAVIAPKILDSLAPPELAHLVQTRDAELLAEKANLRPEQAQKVLVALSSPELLHELEVVEMTDQPKIELREDGGGYKDSLSLSTGQKCTTILPILLLDSGNPLLVDQPEDNLDNRFIFETIVTRIQEVKRNRQMIFVTHNPNIPVLGDAEKVFVLESDGESGKVTKSGGVDDCRNEIITLLEGGEKAFRQRQERYSRR